ncbi:MAG: hypothetical protein DMD91_32520 [Candidatus Rokuibacteriota bacterium]|nr:MAG: hypothetical protein DMD91_32520 [Candidatus Rokubacteria bacterium]
MKRAQPSSAQHRLEVLYDVTRRLAAVHETEKILDLIVNAATRLLGVEAAALRLLDGDELVLRARTESAAALVARTRIHVGESLSGRVVAGGEVVVVEDLVTDTRYDANHKSAALALGYHGYLGVPLSAHGRIIGALNVYTTKQHRFAPDEIALVESFANQASLAIEQDRLLRDARERASRLQSLARLNQVVSSSLDTTDVLRAIASAAAQLTGASAVACWIADTKQRVLERRAVSDDGIAADYPSSTVAFGEGLIGSVATRRKTADVPDVSADPRLTTGEWFRAHELSSALIAPVLFHDLLLGVLGLFGRQPFRLASDDQELLDVFLTQAGVAIHNARMYDEARVASARLEERGRELDLLNRVGEMLQACVTEEEAYTVVSRFVGQFFRDDVGAVFVTSASRNLVEAKAAWGTVPTPDWAIFKPEDCWALRRGRIHLVESTDTGLLCTHLQRPIPSAYLCIPLIAQGESLGVFYLSGTTSLETKQRLALNMADQLGLAVANLKLRETLRNQSIRDPLTGLYNRRYLEATLERELHRVVRSGGTLGVIVIDLDHFKQFNDTFGHEVGDLLLRELGRLLRSSVRGGDVPCRYGGEEFVLVLPEASASAALERAERLRDAVKQLHLSHKGQSIGSVTMSAGVATFPEHGQTGELLLQAADSALYSAKAEGRDRVLSAR